MEEKYLRMVRGMKKKRGRREWTVYLLRCADGTLYTGIAKNVKERLRKHNAGKGSSYVRSRRPARVVHTEGPLTRSKALMREAKIKGFGKRRKETLVAGRRSKGARDGRRGRGNGRVMPRPYAKNCTTVHGRTWRLRDRPIRGRPYKRGRNPKDRKAVIS